ncbi:hypothetical protein FACS189487_08990 [Campylobacterota bacterium]|nr:hypothetical protein FACS189487_08990 [Campylobacterota bacterium]
MDAKDAKVDMYYRFTQDDEPTEEQLQVIMQEVAEDARREHAAIDKQLIETLESEYLRLRSAQQGENK